jgi:twitching motility protein PilI
MSSAGHELPTSPADGPGSVPSNAERRSRLRRYQAQLLERMHDAQSGAAASGRELGVQFGASRCLLDLTQIGEIVPWQPPSPVPMARDWYLGLANIRGNLTGIIDFARYLDYAPTPPGADSRIITFAPGLGFNCALLAARVLGLRRLDELSEQTLAENVQPWCVQQFLDQEGQLWTRLDLAQLVLEERFLQVGL